MGWLSGLIQGATTAKTGYNQGQNERKMLAIKLALEEAARRREQGNADREYERRVADDDFDRAQPRAPVLGTPEYITAQKELLELKSEDLQVPFQKEYYMNG